MSWFRRLVLSGVAVLLPVLARADVLPRMALPSPGLQCRQAIAMAERGSQIPPHLLAAIAHVESGRRDPQTGAVNPWPWSINVEGTDHVYETEAEAIAAVRSFQAAGSRSIDVGCMQVNLMFHPDAFGSLEQAFDPQANAAYAARFLTQLHGQTGSWDKATAWYHSATPELGDDYLRKVSAVMPEEAKITTDPSMALAAPLSRLGGGGIVGMAGMIMPLRSGPPRLIPLPGMAGGLAPGPAATGRGLDSYRSFPVAMASRR